MTRADLARAALANMCAMLDTYGDPTLGLAPGDFSKLRDAPPSIQPLRVTIRGNVYDDTLGCSVLATWGMGSIKERRRIAAQWIAEGRAVAP